MMIDVVNLQRKIKLDLAPIRAFVADLLASVEESANATFTVAFIGDGRMKQLNELFRNKNTTTDVLSFPNEPDDFAGSTDFSRQPAEGGTPNAVFLGDIVISAEQAQKQAAENGLSLDAEIKQLILHGLLHLCGHDHETDNGEMNTRELDLRNKLGI
ncbi:MAG TPA: rRNA maturation RNase YbeY [Pyrinomonadaceae bacterium]|nr:rRNA maturation RNase YbeY [Pyrinomonadaceae bacterium]